jgi:hypothetical protein
MVPDVLKVESGPLLNDEDTKGLSDKDWAKMGRLKEESHRNVDRIIKGGRKRRRKRNVGDQGPFFFFISLWFQIQPARPFATFVFNLRSRPANIMKGDSPLSLL